MNGHKFKTGQIVTVTARKSGHGTAIGTKMTISGSPVGRPGNYSYYTTPDMGWTYREDELTSEAITKEQVNADLVLAQKEVDSIIAKIDWMENTGQNTYDEDEFKAYSALRILDSSKDDVARAKELAKLMK